MKKLTLISLFLGIVLLSTCQSRRPYVGVIQVNTDLPVLHKGKLPIGITLDPGSGGRDLLSTNMLLNGDFDLAPRMVECAYNAVDSTIITPNGFRIFYPLPQQIYGWKVLGGNISVEDSAENHYLLINSSSTDSIVAIQQEMSNFPAKSGAQYRFSVKAQAYGDVRIKVTLVNDSLQPLSNQVTLTPLSEQSVLRGDLKLNEDSDKASLLIEFSMMEGETYFVETDSISYWSTRRRATIHLDDCKLYPSELTLKADVSSELHDLLKKLSPSFLRYPSGRTANGYYPGSYPLHLDSLEKKPIWTLNKNEWSGDFTYNTFLNLAHSIESTPILVTNFGYTDHTTFQRVEGAKEADQRYAYIAQLFNQAGGKEIAIQAGYDLSGAEYANRFRRMLSQLEGQTHDLQIISATSLQPYERYSDYPFDRVLPIVTYSSLPQIDSLLRHHDYMLYPQVITEVNFDSNYYDGYFLPPLALRAIFMLLAERYTPSIMALGISPLLSDNIERDFPLIEVTGGHYRATLFYQFLSDFQQFRGENLRRLAEKNDVTSDIFLSLTSDITDQYYYLKAVNVTRHPLHYKIALEGLNTRFESVNIISYTTTGVSTSSDLEGFTHYNRSLKEKNLSTGSSFSYLFQPYEVTIFVLKKK